MKRLCVAGSLHLDVVVNAPHLPRLDETLTGEKVAYIFGGKGGNQALAADRHGASVYFIGRIGNDAFGQTLIETLDNGSIDITQLQRDNGPSGMSVAIVNKEGDYGAVIVSAANLRIDKEAFSISKDTEILLLQNEIPEHVNISASQKAKEHGCQVWLNAAPARKMSSELLSKIDVLIMNRIEAKFYESNLLSGKASHITRILTLGSKGVQIQCPGEELKSYPAYPVNPHSAHGAGDTFVGSLAAGRLAGKNFESALNYAQAAAALYVSTPLRKRPNLCPEEVLRFLQN